LNYLIEQAKVTMLLHITCKDPMIVGVLEGHSSVTSVMNATFW